jgi:hypothetical protein
MDEEPLEYELGNDEEDRDPPLYVPPLYVDRDEEGEEYDDGNTDLRVWAGAGAL